MRASEDGRVGIGDTSPDATLDVAGTAIFESTVTMPTTTTGVTDAAGEMIVDTDGDGATIQDGVIQYYDGTDVVYTFGSTTYPSADDQVLKYDAAANAFVWEADDSGAGATAWSDIGDATADATIGLVDYETTFTSSLDGGVVMKIDSTSALTTNTTLLELEYTQDEDPQGYYLQARDNDGDSVLTIGQKGSINLPQAYIGLDITFGSDASSRAIGLFSSTANDGNFIDINSDTGAFTGDVLNANLANGSGTFTGQFIDFEKDGTDQFVVDDDGDTTTHLVCLSYLLLF